jgi:hypothetical protein
LSISITTLREPWLSFLHEIDQQIDEVTVLPCLGGLIVTECYGNQRTTADFDVLDVAPRSMSAKVIQLAGRGSELALRHRLYIDVVGVASVPYEYESRLADFCPGMFKNLHLRVMDPYDIALSKLSRNLDRDHGDVMYLARAVPFDLDLFERRYKAELRPDLFGNIAEKDDWFQSWLDDIREEQKQRATGAE